MIKLHTFFGGAALWLAVWLLALSSKVYAEEPICSLNDELGGLRLFCAIGWAAIGSLVTMVVFSFEMTWESFTLLSASLSIALVMILEIQRA